MPDGLHLGDIVNGYKIIQQLASGGEGTTFLVKKGNNKYLLKRYHFDKKHPNYKVLKKRLLRLKKLIGKKHNNIVSIYDIFEEDDTWYEVQDYLEGEDLSSHICNHGPLKPTQLYAMLENMLSALIFLHEQCNMIHRDIKPANIMVLKKGNSKLLFVLIDYGIAFHFDQKPLTTSGANFTPYYVDPCILIYKKNGTTLSTDLYNLGIAAFEAATGKLPFSAQSPADMIREVCTPYRKRISDIVTNIPADLDDFIYKLMAFNLKDRFPTAREALKELQNSSGSVGFTPTAHTAKPKKAKKRIGLHILNGQLSNSTIIIPDKGIALGRVMINPSDFRISRLHLRVSNKNGQLKLNDQNSANGFYYQGKRRKSLLLHPDEEVTIGCTTLRCITT